MYFLNIKIDILGFTMKFCVKINHVKSTALIYGVTYIFWIFTAGLGN